MKKKALIAMSGGVDSSVAAYLMNEKGFECIGATMKLYQNEQLNVSKEHTCCSLDDVEDARNVAISMGMPHSQLVKAMIRSRITCMNRYLLNFRFFHTNLQELPGSSMY